MRRLGPVLARAAGWLQPHRDELLQSWVRAVADVRGIPEDGIGPRCQPALEHLLARLAAGELEALLADDTLSAERDARHGASLLGLAVETRLLNRCLGTVLARVCPDPAAIAETLVALDELGEPCREIVELRYFGDLSYEDLSLALQLNPKTVSSRLSKCLDRLEAVLRKNFSRERSDVFPSNL